MMLCRVAPHQRHHATTRQKPKRSPFRWTTRLVPSANRAVPIFTSTRLDTPHHAADQQRNQETKIMEDDSEPEIRVRFVTRLDECRVTAEPVSVPLRLARYGLSEVVNHLLGNDASSAIPFDFLYENDTAEASKVLDGDDEEEDEKEDEEEGDEGSEKVRGTVTQEFVRSSLGRFVRRKEISKESILQLEYLPVQAPPAPGPSSELPDWVASVDARLCFSSGRGLVITGAYDGGIRAHFAVGGAEEPSFAVASVASGHRRGVKGVAAATVKRWDGGVEALVVSASQDMTARVWRLRAQEESDDKTKKKKKKKTKKKTRDGEDEVSASFAPVAVCSGHEGSVDAVAISPSREVFATGSWDQTVCIWSMAAGVRIVVLWLDKT